jgi:phosphorylcholine metabolism protein LicD
MASVFRLSKKRFFLLFTTACVILVLRFFRIETTSETSLSIQQLDSHPIPYANIHPCKSLANCPDLRLKANTTLRRSQLVLTRLLRAFDLVCKKHSIQFFLYKGTLLGAARHKGHNPFDGDMDLALPQQDYDKLSSIIQQELPSDVFFQTEKTDPYYKKPKLSYMFAKLRDTKSCYVEYLSICLNKCLQNGLQVDISVLQTDASGNLVDLFSSENLIRRFLRGPLLLKTSDVFPLKELEFEGFYLPVPNKWKKLLEYWYGRDFMTIPAPSARHKILSGSDIDPLHSCDEVKRRRKMHVNQNVNIDVNK